MKHYEVVGYAYDADVHCIECARKAHSDEDLRDLSSRHIQEWGGTLDSDPQPIFAGDETAGEEYCGDCGEALME